MALTQQLAYGVPQATAVSGYNPGTLRPSTGLVQGNLEAFLNPNSELMQQARRSGTELAATRGGINSSIAAGASQRASLDTAQQLANQATQIDQNREAVRAEEWASTNNFNRAMLGQFSSAAFQNSLGMLESVQQMALQDPELYTPEVISGLSDFFSRNATDILGRYFGRTT